MLPLAGCVGDDESVDPDDPEAPDDVTIGDFDDPDRIDRPDEDDEPVDELVAQDFVLHQEANPEECVFWHQWDNDRWFDEGIDMETAFVAHSVAYTPSFLANYKGNRTFYSAPTDHNPQTVEPSWAFDEDLDTERTDFGVQLEVVDHPVTGERPRWSDGVDIKAADVAITPIYARFPG